MISRQANPTQTANNRQQWLLVKSDMKWCSRDMNKDKDKKTQAYYFPRSSSLSFTFCSCCDIYFQLLQCTVGVADIYVFDLTF